VTHVAKGKGIPPFLILYVADHPDSSAQARRLAAVLKGAGLPAVAFGAKDTSRTKINADFGRSDDPGAARLRRRFAEEVTAEPLQGRAPPARREFAVPLRAA
jgi:hypothetical protein